MRIISGVHKGRVFKTPKGKGTRPTTDQARESLFNILSHRPGFSLQGARVIDLFAGSGALGLEALSRGASFCLFIETASVARAVIRENIEHLDLFGRARLLRRSATELGARPASIGGGFDIAFLDAPYRLGLLAPAIESLLRGDWLEENALIITEQDKSEPACIYPSALMTASERDIDTRTSGRSRFQIIRLDPRAP